MSDSDPGAVRQRRAFPRVPLRAKVRMEFTEQRWFLSEWAVNLSPGGMFVRTEAEVGTGQRFEFDAGLSGHGPRFGGVGEVTWIRHAWEGSSRPPGFAVRFLELEESGRSAIERLAEVFLADGVAAMQAELETLAEAWQRRRLEEEATGELPPFDEDELLPDTAVIPPPEPLVGDAASPAPRPEDAAAGSSPPVDRDAETPAAGIVPTLPASPSPSPGGPPPGPGRRWGALVLLVSGVGVASYLGWWALAAKSPEVPVSAGVASPAPLHESLPSGMVAPAAAAVAADTSFQTVSGVSWSEEPEGLWVVLALDGELPADGYRRYRASQPPPREVLQLLGARRGFPQSELAVGSPLLTQIRFGFHTGEQGDELRVVLDLGSPAVALQRVEHAGSALRLLLSEDGPQRAAAPAQAAAPPSRRR